MFNFSCSHQVISCVTTPDDASTFPLTSFMYAELDNYIMLKECKEVPCPIAVSTSYASGFLALKSSADRSMGYVITAHHFCKARLNEAPPNADKLGHQFHVYDYFGRKHHAEYLLSDETTDVCVLIIKDVTEDLAIAKLALTLPKKGSRVYTISAPNGYFSPEAGLIFEGLYSGTLGAELLMTIPTESGSSGSPIFNQDGLVIGMTTSIPMRKHKTENNETVIEKISSSVCISASLYSLVSALNAASEIDDLIRVSATSTKSESHTR